MTITTVMTFFVIRYGWKYLLWLYRRNGIFFVIDIASLRVEPARCWSAAGSRWSSAGMFMMQTWNTPPAGHLAAAERAIDLPGFLDAVRVSPPARVPAPRCSWPPRRG